MKFLCSHCGKRIKDIELAHYLAAKGGASRSAAKVAAARANGRKGGRPKKEKKNHV